MICARLPVEEYNDMYRFFYQNLDFWSDGDEQKEGLAILAIRDGLVKHQAVSDVEICLSATIVELEQIAKG